MDIRRNTVGSVPDGAGRSVPVDSYTLDTGAGLAIEVWTYGATLVEVRVPDRDGRVCNVVLRLPDLDAYRDRRRNAYLGATVGRYCRVVGGGAFALDGVRHELVRNAGMQHIHGGNEGFDRLVWTADAGRDGDRLSVRLRLVSPDGDQGYPGELSAETAYHLDADGTLTFEHRATTDAPTVVGFTNHAFWNLAGRGTIDGHRLALNSTRFLACDSEFVPTDAAPPLTDRFVTARTIGAERVDNFFVLDDPAWAAELADPLSGRVMRVRTDEPGVGVYTGDHYREPRAGICLETGPFPDAPNRPDFPSVRLDPGMVYHRRTVHEFTTTPNSNDDGATRPPSR